MRIGPSNLSPTLVDWLIGLGCGPMTGDVYFLTPANSANAYYYSWLQKNGVRADRLFTSFPTAYAAMTANRNDTLIVAPGAQVQTAAIDWAKDYTHMFGAFPGGVVNQRARITTATAGLSPFFTLSGDGCVFKDVMISQEGSHATSSAIALYITGDRCRFERFTVRHIGALGVVDNSCRTLKLASSNGEHYFVDCTIGADTVDGVTATNYVIEFANTNQGNQRIIFDRCNILGNGSANSAFVLATAANCIDGSWVMFRDCLFSNPMAGDYDQMTQGFYLNTACNGVIYMVDNLVYGCATYETSNSGVLIGRNAYAAATTDSGVALTF